MNRLKEITAAFILYTLLTIVCQVLTGITLSLIKSVLPNCFSGDGYFAAMLLAMIASVLAFLALTVSLETLNKLDVSENEAGLTFICVCNVAIAMAMTTFIVATRF